MFFQRPDIFKISNLIFLLASEKFNCTRNASLTYTVHMHWQTQCFSFILQWRHYHCFHLCMNNVNQKSPIGVRLINLRHYKTKINSNKTQSLKPRELFTPVSELFRKYCTYIHTLVYLLTVCIYLVKKIVLIWLIK